MKRALTPRSFAWEIIFLVRDRSELTYLRISARLWGDLNYLQLEELNLTGDSGVHHLIERAGRKSWQLLVNTDQIRDTPD